MKRKDFEDILDSPSTKSRRLDGVLLQCMPQLTDNQSNASKFDSMIMPMPVVDNSEEKAIVLYCPQPDAPFLKSPSSPELPSIIVNSDLIPGIKVLNIGQLFNHIFWPMSSKTTKLIENEMAADKSSDMSNNCLAIVPWVASQLPVYSPADGQSASFLDPMEAEVEGEMMDIEDMNAASSSSNPFEFGKMVDVTSEGFQDRQQQQQHCMAPQFFQSEFTPVTW